MNEKDLKNLFFVWLVATVVVFFAPFFAPGYVVLGNDRVSSLLAPFVSSLLVVVIVKLLVVSFGKYMKLGKSSETNMGLALLFGYVFSVWLVSRAALYVGLGIASFWVAIGIGIILATTEYWFMKLSYTKAPKKVSKKRRR